MTTAFTPDEPAVLPFGASTLEVFMDDPYAPDITVRGPEAMRPTLERFMEDVELDR